MSSFISFYIIYIPLFTSSFFLILKGSTAHFISSSEIKYVAKVIGLRNVGSWIYQFFFLFNSSIHGVAVWKIIYSNPDLSNCATVPAFSWKNALWWMIINKLNRLSLFIWLFPFSYATFRPSFKHAEMFKKTSKRKTLPTSVRLSTHSLDALHRCCKRVMLPRPDSATFPCKKEWIIECGTPCFYSFSRVNLDIFSGWTSSESWDLLFTLTKIIELTSKNSWSVSVPVKKLISVWRFVRS